MKRTYTGFCKHAFATVLTLLVATPAAMSQTYGNGSNGAFSPLVNTTLNTTANGGVFQFTSIQIPAGVTVTLVGSNPAILMCQGSVVIDGTLTAQATGYRWIGTNHSGGPTAGPGGFDGASGGALNGAGPGGGQGGGGSYPVSWGSCGSHATGGWTNPFNSVAPTYGTALPFDLRGGSGGGAPGTGTLGGYGPGPTGGGGTIVVLAGGSITITGTVNARGGDHVFSSDHYWVSRPSTGGRGSGGSILLRSLQCIQVTGRVDARAGATSYIGVTLPPQGPEGAGFIRIDAYSACGAPQLTGADIQPAPLVASMPFLTQLAPARIGRTFPLRVASAPGDVVGFYYSLASSVTPIPPFGVLELDPALILFYGQHTVPTTGIDPLAAINIPIPLMPTLVGITLHAQVFNAFGTVTGAARLSNRLAVTIQN